MAINQIKQTVYYHMSTTNKSFIAMHRYLKDIGIKNNKFMLILFDPDLAGIDPFDPKLPAIYKTKVLRECVRNYWYYLRECVRIPNAGGSPMKYKLDRGNMALTFCDILNINKIYEIPRQCGKTISVDVRYGYLYNFGTTNSEMALLNKRMDDSKLNLQRMKDIRDSLPSYLQMNKVYGIDGKPIKPLNNVETMKNPINNNLVRAYPGARNELAAANILRGRTLPLIWYDEFAFTPYNNIIYKNGVPAFNTAAKNAKANNAPYGITMTSTPGFMTSEEGQQAKKMIDAATPFSELWYDMPINQLMELLGANTHSSFVYIKFSYQQLGKSEEWFKGICVEAGQDWITIRREILLEWSTGVENSPFTKEDLDLVAQFVHKPIRQVLFMNKYVVNIYKEIDLRVPPIIGVDVSGGYNRDASAITCINSRDTTVFADFNCNYISTIDLAQLVYELVSKYLTNAVVNVERNGGFGASVLAKLVNSSIKKNLYFEIKDRVLEEKQMGTKIVRKTQAVKVYGLDSTHAIRDLLIQILRDRMDYHKDKFISENIYNELLGMEVKRNGKVEHSSTTHDDQVFSYLMALYVWYEGKDLRERFGIQKDSLKTDQNIDEEVLGMTEPAGDITEQIEEIQNESEIPKQLDAMKKAAGSTMNEWLQAEMKQDQEAMDNLLSTKLGKIAYSNTYNIPLDEVPDPDNSKNIPDSVFSNFYK